MSLFSLRFSLLTFAPTHTLPPLSHDSLRQRLRGLVSFFSPPRLQNFSGLAPLLPPARLRCKFSTALERKRERERERERERKFMEEHLGRSVDQEANKHGSSSKVVVAEAVRGQRTQRAHTLGMVAYVEKPASQEPVAKKNDCPCDQLFWLAHPTSGRPRMTCAVVGKGRAIAAACSRESHPCSPPWEGMGSIGKTKTGPDIVCCCCVFLLESL
ncbi:hypothetical protein BDP55DRAFT_89053 [Colletotrichum godetiae]|uniref:Uncharacterized protein n=1 Tax=Colletotrichum godetiae TaxID=1209918 RepID=A0AAJ0ARY3_9PEZI|nr:uncharacterized protein BDP55DRAFT_89053 [Colletotrichum godetiae]KAK1687841.1 hypothetical protein BDP55DRAFT_89053 [Colletotrichum godetiae]